MYICGKRMRTLPRTRWCAYRTMPPMLSQDIPCLPCPVVVSTGAFDLFNIGHIMALKAASELGDYLIVGIHGDDEVMKVRGAGNPLCNIHERTLGVLQCKVA